MTYVPKPPEERRRIRIATGLRNAEKREAFRRFLKRAEGQMDAQWLRVMFTYFDAAEEWHRIFAQREWNDWHRTRKGEDRPDIGHMLVDALTNGGERARCEAADWLKHFHAPGDVDALTVAVSDPLAKVREKAIATLGWRKVSRAYSAVQGRLRDPDEGVVSQAIRTLPELDHDLALEPLLRMTADKAWQHRLDALYALWDHRDDVVLRTAKALSVGDPKRKVRRTAKLVLIGFDQRRRKEGGSIKTFIGKGH